MGNPVLAPEERFAYRHYRTWPKDERWELIDGQAWNMSPAPGTRHQDLSGRLFLLIATYLKGKTCKVFAAPFDVLMPEADEPDDDVSTVVQPDIVVICDRSKLDSRGARGAPDWIVEILSPSTAAKDYGVKLALYRNRGVREYWIVDPAAKVVHAWVLGEDGQYCKERIYAAGDRASSAVLSGLVVDTAELFSDLDY
jgi:Uma2 family endonuclease